MSKSITVYLFNLDFKIYTCEIEDKINEMSKREDCSEQDVIKAIEDLTEEGLIDVTQYNNFGKPICFNVTKKGKEVHACLLKSKPQ